MLKLLVCAFVAGLFPLALARADAATAGPGQCYAADGRPTGPAFDGAAPDRDWIRFVIARGGRCTGLDDDAEVAPPRFTAHEAPNHRHLLRHREMQRD